MIVNNEHGESSVLIVREWRWCPGPAGASGLMQFAERIREPMKRGLWLREVFSILPYRPQGLPVAGCR